MPHRLYGPSGRIVQPSGMNRRDRGPVLPVEKAAAGGCEDGGTMRAIKPADEDALRAAEPAEEEAPPATKPASGDAVRTILRTSILGMLATAALLGVLSATAGLGVAGWIAGLVTGLAAGALLA